MTAEPPPAGLPALDVLVELLADPRAPVAASTVDRARDVHVADSLSGLEFEPVASARRLADLGSGAGLPGLVLAASLPGARVDLVESSGRKCEFLRMAAERMGLQNTAVICERSEDWSRGEGREAYDVVTARAIGSLPVVAELASPLLTDGGVLVAWKGSRSPEEEEEVARAAGQLAMEAVEVRPVRPYPGSRGRHIHLLRKNGATPNGLPRRPGMAAKRRFGTEST